MLRRALLALSALALGADALAVDSRTSAALQPGLRQVGEEKNVSLPPLNHLGLRGSVGEGEGGNQGGSASAGKPGGNASAEYPDADPSTHMCITQTGGTCMMQDCHSWRGAVCIWSECRCPQGTCSGADGKCYPQQNKVVQESVRFSNVAWPQTQLAMNSWSVWTASHDVGASPAATPDTEFMAVSLPDGAPMLVSKANPGYALITFEEENHDEEGTKKKVVKAGRIAALWAPALATRFTAVPWKQGAVMISSHFKRFREDYYLAWYLGRVSTPAFWSAKDPGEMGYWTPDRPLGVELQPFEGGRCYFDCNHMAYTVFEGLMFLFLLALVGFGLYVCTAVYLYPGPRQGEDGRAETSEGQ